MTLEEIERHRESKRLLMAEREALLKQREEQLRLAESSEAPSKTELLKDEIAKIES